MRRVLIASLWWLFASAGASAKDEPTKQKYFMYVVVYQKSEVPGLNHAKEVFNKVAVLEGRYGELKKAFTEKAAKEFPTTNMTRPILFVPTSKLAVVFRYKMKKLEGISNAIGVAEGDTKKELDADMAYKLKQANGYDPVIFRVWPNETDLN